MSEDDKGKRFLELIDEQNNLQWSIIKKLSSLIGTEWKSIEKVDRVVLIKSDQSEVFIIAGDLTKDIVVKDLGEGTYYIGYFLGRVSIATETLIVGK